LKLKDEERSYRAGRVALAIEHMPSKLKVMNSTPSTMKKRMDLNTSGLVLPSPASLFSLNEAE
jgi:hypothetical protein